AIVSIREINCSVLGDSTEIIPSVLEEPIMHGEILDYGEKYLGKSGGKGMASLSRKVPAELSPEKATEIQSIAVKAFKVLGGSGVSRIDFIMDMMRHVISVMVGIWSLSKYSSFFTKVRWSPSSQ
ncbi:MAG: hypothetical protein II376_07580, partial [Clostridia bacterium]|nr:hypothetical protein [Clostridia bacterium]